MKTETKINANNKTAVIPPPSKMSGSKFVVAFLIVCAVTSIIFCYAMYQSYLTRPKVDIQEEKK